MTMTRKTISISQKTKGSLLTLAWREIALIRTFFFVTLFLSALYTYGQKPQAPIAISKGGEVNITPDELSIKNGVSATRIRQIAEKTCNKLTYNEDIVIAELSTNRALMCEVDNLKKVVKSLKVKFDEYRRSKGDKPVSGAVLPPLILSRDINDCGFSTRILNALRWIEVYTVGDLLRKFHCKSDLYKIRNLGKKTILIILDFIEENNLSFKQDEESDEDFYIRLNNKLPNQKD